MSSRDGNGIELSRAFFADLVQPILNSYLPERSYAAGRLGAGSDALGLDDEISRDHDWGLRLSVFVAEEDLVSRIKRALDEELPTTFRGFPVRFPFTGESVARHHVDVATVPGFVSAAVGFDPTARPTTSNWLSITGQAALEVTAGPVFFDGTGELRRAREALSWYPDDLWRYVLACDWARLSQEMPFMGRASDVGDELGCKIISARLAQVVMHLTFLLARRWPPYSKWFGTVWSALPGAEELRPALEAMTSGTDHASREKGLADALQTLLERQNQLGLSNAPFAIVPFWDRPYLHTAPEVAESLLGGISDETVRALPLGLGSIEQRTDNVDVLVSPQRRNRFIRD